MSNQWHTKQMFAWQWITIIHTLKVKAILTVIKQLKQLQRKPRKNSEAPPELEPLTSTILMQCPTD